MVVQRSVKYSFFFSFLFPRPQTLTDTQPAPPPSYAEALEYGSLVQLWVPKHQSNNTVLVTHRDLARVRTTNDIGFWKYHENSSAFFFNTHPTSNEVRGGRRRCRLNNTSG